MFAARSAKSIMSQSLQHAKTVVRRSKDRGHADHGWLDTYHTFSFANYYDPNFETFGALRVLNEDRVAPQSGFPFHTHRNAEIFSYILSGELTHRDSMMGKGAANSTADKDLFYRIRRGDVQFTTGGSGISHSEQNEHSSEPVHFLQIWALPWKSGLTPRYHDLTVTDERKRAGFVPIISPLKAGIKATVEEEKAAIPAIEGTIPIHADLVMGASIIAEGTSATWKVGAGAVTSKESRNVYIHLPMTNAGKAKVGMPDGTVLGEGDGAFVSKVNEGDALTIESIGTAEAETITQKRLSSNATTNSLPNLNAAASYAIVQAAIQRTQDRLFNDNFVPWKFHPRNSDFEPANNASQVLVKSVIIQQNQSDSAAILKPRAGEVNERYTLSITAAGAVEITSVSSIGILRALETFTQLFYEHSSNGGVYSPYAPVNIIDAPKFGHRGFNMDVARSYYPPSFILHTIDALSWNKFNRLHLHVTDAQSWPLDIPALPNLSIKGAYQAGLSYSREQLAQIQEYAMYRGIEVFLEIDMPGHTSAIALAYPDLITGYNVQPNWGDYAAEPPSGSLKLNSSAVYAFLHTLWEDLLPRVAPYSAYFHTGGDEVKANVYNLDETVRSNATSVLQPLLQKFVDFNHDYVRAAGMTPVVWEEMLLQWNLTLGSDVVVQTWLSDEAVAQTVAKGHKALAGNYNYWVFLGLLPPSPLPSDTRMRLLIAFIRIQYLDCGRGSWLDPITRATSPFLDYCNPFKNWHLVYSYDPLLGIPANSSNLVLGGEVHLWSELADPTNWDSVAWPRAAAAAEVLWSGAKDEQGRNRSLVDAGGRLGEWRERLVGRGIAAGPVQMPFCRMTPGGNGNASLCLSDG
ncbi:MAG: hypothetical protein LQ338_005544 [Usnochroma carphineum]|nr:MAG: hypothetical protein LQ338_005544 [Usnochroma carphineum]